MSDTKPFLDKVITLRLNKQDYEDLLDLINVKNKRLDFPIYENVSHYCRVQILRQIRIDKGEFNE